MKTPPEIVLAALAALILAASPAACGEDGAATADNVADRFASAYCGAAAHCCAAEGEAVDPQSCTSYAMEVALVGKYSVTSGSAVFNPDVAAECIKAAGEFDCWNRNDIEAVCRLVFSGTAPIGASCLADGDCAQSPTTHAVCGGSSGTGMCVADTFFGRAGAPCGAGTLDCAAYEGFRCVIPAGASTGTCQPKSQTGEPCSYPEDCQDGLYCDTSAGSCGPVKKVGDACTASECDWDATCDSAVCTFRATSNGVCSAPPGVNDAGTADAGTCVNGKLWCSCSNSYVACAPDGSADACPCPGTVTVGGDAGSVLPDPGVIFVQVVQIDLVADPTRNVFYIASYNEGVRAVSSETGATLWVASLGFMPAKLAVSDDGSTLYAADESFGSIERVNLAKGAADLSIMLLPDPNTGSSQVVIDLAVVPGSPRTVIAVTASGTQGALVQALDDGVPRAASAQVDYMSVIQLDGPSTIYGLGPTGALTTLTLTASGVQSGPSGPVPSLFTPNRGEFLFDGELAFADDGHVVDPRQGVLLGTYSAAGFVAVDRLGGRSYVAIPGNATSSDYRLTIGEFDRTAFTRLRTLTLSLQGMPTSNLVRTPDGTLAVGGAISVTAGPYGVVLIRPDAWQTATTP